MNAYTAQTLINIKLTFRDRTVIFFNYAFPLIFFFMFGTLNNAERGGAIVQVLTMVLTIGILGTGFFGAGIRAVQDREQNILRRFKVAPISAAPILVSSLVTGLINFMPGAVLMVLLSHFLYGMPFPQRWLSLFLFLCLGVIAFRSLGMIIASVVNSMQESQILIQLLYFPMLLLSGATIPLSILPTWVQIFSQFLPATYLITGMQAILGRGETLAQNAWSAAALVLASILALFVSLKLFRWEKDEKVPAKSKLWIVAVLTPFLISGIYQSQSRENLTKSKLMERQERRSRAVLIRNVRVFVGDGKVIESGGVLIRNGKIERVYEGAIPDAKDVKADEVEGSGKTLIPGLIDVHVHLGAPGGFLQTQSDADPYRNLQRELAAYLYSGITAVKSVGDLLDPVLKVRKQVNSGERLGAELFLCGPLFTAPGGHGTEYFKGLPDNIRKNLEAQFVRTPKSPREARQQVDELKKQGVDGIKAVLESGMAGMLFNRLDVEILKAISEEAHATNLPIVIHTGSVRDVEDALKVRANGIEHGSMREPIPEELFARMKAAGVAFDPTLTVFEAIEDLAAGKTDLLERPLLQQVGPAKLLASTKEYIRSEKSAKMREGFKGFVNLDVAKQNLLHAWQSGVLLVTGSDAGNPLVLHGPTIHREMQLWVDAGLPPSVALQAATYSAAKLLRAERRMGLIRPGFEATMVMISGDPLKDIHSTENIQSVFLKGERVDRSELFNQDKQ
jgi:imidazolonepropionase-like amidohydrolase/ABC-type multidrug transport system permease subunit